MLSAQLFFLSDEYFDNFKDDKLMKNKETVDGVPHSRPCFLAFKDSARDDIYWIVPISSNYKKYNYTETQYGNSRKKSTLHCCLSML